TAPTVALTTPPTKPKALTPMRPSSGPPMKAPTTPRSRLEPRPLPPRFITEFAIDPAIRPTRRNQSRPTVTSRVGGNSSEAPRLWNLATRPAPHRALEKEVVRYLQYAAGLAGVSTDFHQRRVDHIDVGHAALETGLLAVLKDLDIIAQPEGLRAEDEDRTEDVREHAPGGEE